MLNEGTVDLEDLKKIWTESQKAVNNKTKVYQAILEACPEKMVDDFLEFIISELSKLHPTQVSTEEISLVSKLSASCCTKFKSINENCLELYWQMACAARQKLSTVESSLSAFYQIIAKEGFKAHKVDFLWRCIENLKKKVADVVCLRILRTLSGLNNDFRLIEPVFSYQMLEDLLPIGFQDYSVFWFIREIIDSKHGLKLDTEGLRKIFQEKFDFKGMILNEFECFRSIFLTINEQLGNISNITVIRKADCYNPLYRFQQLYQAEIKEDEFRLSVNVLPSQVEGIDIIWSSIINRNYDDSIVKKLVDLLVMIYMSPSTELKSKAVDIKRDYLEQCYNHLIDIINNKPIQYKEVFVKRCLRCLELIDTLMEKTEQLESKDSQSHKQLGKGKMYKLVVDHKLLLSKRIPPRAYLLYDSDTLNPKVENIFTNWFLAYSDNGLMSPEQCASFIISCTHDDCRSNDLRVQGIFKDYDTDNDGFLTLDNFLKFYLTCCKQRQLVVWHNLKSNQIGDDLQIREKSEQKPFEESPLVGHLIASNQKYMQLLFSLFDLDERIANKALELVNNLPTDPQLFADIVTLKGVRNVSNPDERDWNQILNPNLEHRFLYTINIVDYLIKCSSSDEQEQEQETWEGLWSQDPILYEYKKTWSFDFASYGGFEYLHEVITNQIKPRLQTVPTYFKARTEFLLERIVTKYIKTK